MAVKSDLIAMLAARTNLPAGTLERVFDCMFDSMVEALARAERIELRGFGCFTMRKYHPYEGRNPKTGLPISVRYKRLPRFKVGKELRDRLNQKRPEKLARPG